MTYDSLIKAIFKGFISSTMWELQDMFTLTFISIFHTLFSNKEFTLLAKQEINNQTCKTVRINMNSKVNISQSQVSSSNITWQKLGQKKSCEKLSQKYSKYTNQKKKLTYIFYQFQTCKNITKQPKMHQETSRNFLGIFCKKNKAHRGSDSKNRGVYSKNTKKNARNQSPRVKSPKPTQADGSGSSGCLRGVGLIRIL